MASRGNQPLLAVAMAPYAAVATAGQSYFPIPGGVVPGLNIVAVGGALLSPGDFDDSDGLGINLAVGIAAGTQFQLYAMGYNTGYVPVGGQLAPFRNKLINGNFDLWQRGTSLAAGTGTRYLSDRWIDDSSVTTIAPSRQAFAPGQTDVPGEPAYFHRSVVASSAGASNYAQLIQRIESARTLAGQAAMLSFYAKADASKNIAVEFSRLYGTGGSPSAVDIGIGAQLVPLTAAWKQFKIPITIPSIAGKTLGTNGDDWLALNFWLDAGSNYNARAASLGQQSGTFDIARVQLEPGSVATDFEGRHIQQELALAQRFYEIGAEPYQFIAGLTGVTAAYGDQRFLVPKRAAPTMSLASWAYWSGGSDTGFTPVNITSTTTGYRFQGVGLTNWTGWNGTGSWTASAEL